MAQKLFPNMWCTKCVRAFYSKDADSTAEGDKRLCPYCMSMYGELLRRQPWYRQFVHIKCCIQRHYADYFQQELKMVPLATQARIMTLAPCKGPQRYRAEIMTMADEVFDLFRLPIVAELEETQHILNDLTAKVPNGDELEEFEEEGLVPTLCPEGCDAEPDGCCPHGFDSLLVVHEMI